MARRNSLTNKFSDIALDEPLKIEIEDRDLELEVYAEDISTFMLIGQQEGEVEKKHMDQLEETLRNILQRTYLPYYNKPADKEMNDLTQEQEEEQEQEKKAIEGLLTRYYTDIFTGITEELGWHDGDMDATGLRNKKKEIQESKETGDSQ